MYTEERRGLIVSQVRSAGRVEVAEPFVHLGDLAQVDTIVTDSELPNAAVLELEAAGPKVVRA